MNGKIIHVNCRYFAIVWIYWLGWKLCMHRNLFLFVFQRLFLHAQLLLVFYFYSFNNAQFRDSFYSIFAIKKHTLFFHSTFTQHTYSTQIKNIFTCFTDLKCLIVYSFYKHLFLFSFPSYRKRNTIWTK